MPLPSRKFETGDDDIQTIDNDIDSLTAKFLTPVDNLRSFSAPGRELTGIVNEAFRGIKLDNVRPLESRVHAFYRFIGFPVATAEGFYNPGFNPNGGQFLGELTGISKKRSNVDAKFNNAPFKNVIISREEDPAENSAIFARQDINSSVYALFLSKDIRPFQVLDENLGPFEVDKQTFSVDSRKKTVEKFLTEHPSVKKSSISLLQETFGVSFSSSRHILRPFVVDPRIEVTTMPDTNRIAVPFLLDSDSLKIDQGKSVKRPGIELIIRERLRKSAEEDALFLEAVEKIASGEIGPSDLLNEGANVISTQDIKNSVEAILGGTIDDVAILELQGTTTVQVVMINRLVKTIKAILKVLLESIEAIDVAISEIDWVPLPSSEGAEQGANGAKIFPVSKEFKKLTEIDQRFLVLSLKKLSAERRITDQSDLGNFASPFNISTNNEDISRITNEMDKLEEEKTSKSIKALKAMGHIELINGEASGLGLIDILSIYIALWAMDESSLVSLLDDDAFGRLVNSFPSLVVGAAADRRDAGKATQNISIALGNFEEKLINVFKFVQREFTRQGLAPGEEEGGIVSPDS